MRLKMRKTYPAVTEKDLNGFEGQLGSRLPPEYREFLKDQNGGLPEEYLFVKEDEEIAVRFFGLGLPEDLDYDDALAARQRYGELPPNLFPIGADPGGNPILIGIGSQNEGQIFYWDTEAEPDDSAGIVFRKVSETLSDFVSSLQKDPGEP